MKKIYYALLLLMSYINVGAQTTLFSANFNGGNNGFTDLTVLGDNSWVINSNYTGSLLGFITNTPSQPTEIIGNPNSGSRRRPRGGVRCPGQSTAEPAPPFF